MPFVHFYPEYIEYVHQINYYILSSLDLLEYVCVLYMYVCVYCVCMYMMCVCVCVCVCVTKEMDPIQSYTRREERY